MKQCLHKIKSDIHNWEPVALKCPGRGTFPMKKKKKKLNFFLRLQLKMPHKSALFRETFTHMFIA